MIVFATDEGGWNAGGAGGGGGGGGGKGVFLLCIYLFLFARHFVFHVNFS